MSTLHRAVIRAYNSGTHKADVRLVTSLPTDLAGVPVATNILPALVVAGRECAVLLFDDNPDNAVVVTVHGAVPPAGAFGDSTFDDQIAVGPSPSIKTNIYAYIGNASGVDGAVGMVIDMGGATSAPSSGSVIGVAGRGLAAHASTTAAAYGLDYIAGMNNVTLAAAYGCRTQALVTGSGKTLTDYYGYEAKPGTAVLATITNWTGFHVPQMTTGTNRRPFVENGRSGTPTDADGNRFRSNTQFGSTTGAFGGGDGVIGIADRTTAPTSNPSGGGILYSESGALKWRGSGGTVTTIAPT